MLSQCTRDFGPYNDNLFLCPCLALDFPHCNSSQRGSFLFIFPLYIILILNWLFYSGSCMACTSFLAPSYLMLLAACIHVPPLGLKVFFFFSSLPRCSWFPPLGFPTLCIRLLFLRGDGPGINFGLPSITLSSASGHRFC